MQVINFTTIFLVTATIFLQAGISFALVKGRILKAGGVEVLTKILVNFFMPIFIFNRLVTTFNFDDFPFWWAYPLVGAVMVVLGYGVSQLLLAVYPKFAYPHELKSLNAFNNCGYIPLVLIGVFPPFEKSTLLVYTLLYIIGFDILLWTVGSWLLTRSRSPHVQWRRIFNPPLMTIFFTLIFIGLGWHKSVPESVLHVTQKISSYSLFWAMLVVGGNLALSSFRNFKYRETLLVSLTKLIIIPIVTLIVVQVLHLDKLVGLFIMIQAIVPSAVSLAVLGQYFDAEHKDFISQSIFMTHLLSIVTMPVFMSIYGKLI